jgi:rfaE bifunctional protein nucleotidyltransferase chain/domain/rfaE bifunctional protein kinase chain/domain
VSRIVVVGDALLDRDVVGAPERLAPDAPVPVLVDVTSRSRPGGAGLAAALAAGDGHEVALICALGADAAGEEVRTLLAVAGVRVLDLGLAGRTPEKVRVLAGSHPLTRLDHGGAGAPCGPLGEAARAALAGAEAVLVSDYGRGVAAEPSVRAALAGLRGTPVVWDPHPRGPAPVAGCLLVTPNAAEAAGAAPDVHAPEGAAPIAAHAARAEALRARWGAVDVCVTLGAAGALLVGGDGAPLAVPAPRLAAGDPCGAGDRFAAAAAGRLAAGALPSDAVRSAVASASAFVAAGGAAGWAAEDRRVDAGAAADRDPLGAAPAPARRFARRTAGAAGDEDAVALAARVRAEGGTVVATGGCFDLLHAGHVATLEAARALGDCLVVCLNDDASVRRLKGPERPLVGEADRAAVLAALRCVDAVIVFAEDDPRAVLRRLRPHLWAKGGDYAVTDLPEAATLAGWGGRAVVVPYVAGRSTTRLIEGARAAR